ncbi:MAG: MarR family transcriptional regulator [Pseudomonadota bacterium]
MTTRALTRKDFELLADFRYQMRKFERFSELAAKAEGLMPQQYLLMLQIKGARGRDWASVGELADRLQIRPHAAVALVSRCEVQALVQRRPDPADRRLVRVHLTAEGERLLRRLAAVHRAELKSLEGVFQVPRIDQD